MAKISIAAVVFVVGVACALKFMTRVDIPGHLLGHEALFVPELLSPVQGDELMEMLKKLKTLPTAVNVDGTAYKVRHEHIGEAQPVVNGTCQHPYLVPNSDKTVCTLPGRIDVGKHFILSGGLEGLKENYLDMVSRVTSFGRYLFDLEKYPVVQTLFQQDNFLEAAKTICPAHQQVLDPFQFNFIVQVPGQTVAMHLDAPYFWGATRFDLPQWLLVAMVFSGLWQEQFVNQVQVVGYVHRWNDTGRNGDFVYWDKNTIDYKSVPSNALAASAVDGSKVVHAASVYMKDRKPLRMDKDKVHTLTYVGNDKWQVIGTDGVAIGNYTTDDLRITIVYRARCFASEAERQRFKNLPVQDDMDLDVILEKFRADMELKGVHSGPIGDRLDFALKIMKTYIKYPLSASAVLPYNYCALTRLIPATDYLLKYFC